MPKLHHITLATLLTLSTLALVPGEAQLRQPEAAAVAFEEPPTLQAAAILRPEYLKGTHHTVRPEVSTYAGHNQYVIDSDFGVFAVEGNTLLMQRVAELEAIAKLRDISRTDEYKAALKKAAASPLNAVKELATHPVDTVSGIPKGMWKMLNRAGQSIKEVAQGREKNVNEDNFGEQLIGFSKVKRELALELGVDPYSSNEALQKELNGVAWSMYGGAMTIKLALAPVGGSAGLAISGFSVSKEAVLALRNEDPTDLRRKAGRLLESWRVDSEAATAFLNNPAYSPTNQKLLMDALAKLDGVQGRGGFLRGANEATDELDALFYRRSAQLLAKMHAETPLRSVGQWNGWPLGLSSDGKVILPIEWDYAAWTSRADQFINSLQPENFPGEKITGFHVAITGLASPAVREKLKTKGIQLTEKALPGPLQ